MSAAAIFSQLRENGTVKKTTTNHDMRRYERPHINEVW
jgi:hypothetical protein